MTGKVNGNHAKAIRQALQLLFPKFQRAADAVQAEQDRSSALVAVPDVEAIDANGAIFHDALSKIVILYNN